MLQQRKKDYLQRLIEELFQMLHQFIDRRSNMDDSEKKEILDSCFAFFNTNFGVTGEETADELMSKIGDGELVEQYARIQLLLNEITCNREGLKKALSIVEYLENTDTTFSWDRTVLREDILHQLDENNQ